MAALVVLPAAFTVLTALVWWLPGPVRLLGWWWVEPLSAVVVVAGWRLPASGEPRLARWLLRARNAMGLVLAANVLLSVVYLMLAARSLKMPLG